MWEMGGIYGRFFLLIGGLLASTTVHASNLIIPEICLPRAQQVSIIPTASPSDLKDQLQNTKAGTQVYDFPKMMSSYANTLDQINMQLDDYHSPLFQYLSKCRQSERECHGKLKPSDPFVQKIYCDQQIFRSVVENVLADRLGKFDRCVNGKPDEINLSELTESEIKNIDRSCYYKTTIDNQPFLKNKSSRYINEVKQVFETFKKQIKMEKDKIGKSLIPEGTEFILRKAAEELQDAKQFEVKANHLKTYYNSLELSKMFDRCCKTDLNLQSYQLSSMYLFGAGQLLRQEMDHSGAIIFKTKDALSDLVFKEADRKYWKDILRNQSPLELSPTLKWEYFNYLRDDMLFYNDDHTFDDFVKAAKSRSRKDYLYRLPTHEELDQYMIKYQKKLGYHSPREPSGISYRPVDLTNQQDVIKNFLFDNQFNQNYLYGLQVENDKVKENRFQDLKKKTYYPELAKGILPYQFALVSQAQAIRELQKNTKTFAETMILKNSDKFHEWVDRISCIRDAKNTFCMSAKDAVQKNLLDVQQAQDLFRRKKHDELYKKIMSGEIVITFSGSSENRKYIYSDQFLKGLNDKVKSVNQFCYDHANPKIFKNNPKSFLPLVQILNEKMEDFYKTPRFEEILGNSDFEDDFQFKTSEYENRCFGEGYAFGNMPGLSQITINKIWEEADKNRSFVKASEVEDLMKDVPFRTAYLPSSFAVKKSDLENIEDSIEDHISKEYRNLYKAYSYKSEDDINAFLKESATTRIFAIVNYAIDNPSKEIGQYICYLIQESDASEHDKIITRQMWTNVTLNIALVASVFALPFSGATVILFDSGIAIVATGVATGSAFFQMQYYQHQNDMLDIASATRTMGSRNALSLHESNDQNIADSQTTIIEDLGLFVVAGGSSVVKSKDILEKMLDREYKAVKATRQMEIDKLVSQSSGRVIFDLKPTITDFIYDYRKVSDVEFSLFKKALANGETKSFITDKWKNLVQYLPKDELAKMTWKDFLAKVETKIETTSPQTANVYRAIDITFSKTWLRLKPYFSKLFLNYFNGDLENEARVVLFLQKAKTFEQKYAEKGVPVKVFSDSEIRLFVSKMNHYTMDEAGNFVRTAKKELDTILDDFVARSVKGDPEKIRAWFEPLFNGTLLQPTEWKIITENFHREISSIEDCKSFLRVIKFAKRQYGLRQQFANGFELLNKKEWRRPYVYEQRTNQILTHIDDYFDIAKYTSNKNAVRFINDTQAFMGATGKTVDQAENEIRNAFKRSYEKTDWDDFDLQGLMARKQSLTDEVTKFETLRTDILQRTDQLYSSPRDIDVWSDPLKYKKQFLRDTEKYNEIFRKKYAKYFKTENDIGLAYKQALVKTQIQKNTAYECSLPDSPATMATNKLYGKLAKTISLSTNSMGYIAAHSSEEKTPEWFERFLYDTTMGYIGVSAHAMIFTTKGGGPFYKLLYDYLAADTVSFGSAFIYQGLNSTVWSSDSKYREEFAKIIYESSDVEKTVQDFFKKHPDVEKRILDNFKQIHERLEISKPSLPDGQSLSESDLEIFAKKILIDDVTYSAMKQKDQELGKDYIYHDLLKSGQIDPDLYPDHVKDDEWEDELYSSMAEINYDGLYERKTGQIKYPGMNPWDVGNIDLIEFKTGYEGADRFLFYSIVNDPLFVTMAYPKNMLAYKILCTGRFLPGNSSAYLAAGLHLAYMSLIDPLSYYMRNQVTGH